MDPNSVPNYAHGNTMVLSSKIDLQNEVEKLKLEGNNLFSKRAFDRAAAKYTSALNALSIIGESETRAVILSNRAACYLALKRYNDAVKDCTDSLASDPTFLKSHLRLSKALEDLGDVHGSLRVLVSASNINNELSNNFELRCEVERLSKFLVDKCQLSATWRKLTLKGKPPQNMHCSAVEWNRKFFIFGGMNSQNATIDNQIYVFDTDQLEWSIAVTRGIRPASRSYHSAVTYQDAMLIMGGNHSGFFDMWRLDLVTLTWTQVQMLGHVSQCPPGLSQFMTCVYKDVLFVWGGFFTRGEKEGKFTNNDSLFCFDLKTGEWKKHVFNGSYFPVSAQDRGIWIYEKEEMMDREKEKEDKSKTKDMEGNHSNYSDDATVSDSHAENAPSSSNFNDSMANISLSDKSRAKTICPIKPWFTCGEIFAFGGSKKHCVKRLGVLYDETVFSLDKYSIRENSWKSMAIIGSSIPSPRSQMTTLYLPERDVTVCFAGYYEGSGRKETPTFFNEVFGFNQSLNVFFKVSSRGDRLKAGGKYWVLKREDGRIFVGGGYTKVPKLEIFKDMYELTIQDASEKENEIAKLKMPRVKSNLLTYHEHANVQKSYDDVESNPSDDSPKIRLGSVSAEAFNKIMRGREEAGGDVEGVEEGEGEEEGEYLSVDMDKPERGVDWRLLDEESMVDNDPNFNFMLAKLEFTSRQNMSVKTPSELLAARQPLIFKERNKKYGLRIPLAFDIHIRVRFLHPTVWRRVIIPARMTLAQFHELVLCPVIGWCSGYHAYKIRRTLAEKDETWFGPTNSLASDFMKLKIKGEGLANDTKIFVGDLLTEVGDSLSYVYDFHCNWEHEITLLRKINNSSTLSKNYVEVIDGWGACPAEDSGGIVNYLKLLQIMSDASNPKYKRIYSDIRNAKNKKLTIFDPCLFDLESVRQSVSDALAICRQAHKQAWFEGLESEQAYISEHLSLPQANEYAVPVLPPPIDMCRICGRTDGLMACGACHVAWYCGVQHQQQDWVAGHCYTCSEERTRAMSNWRNEARFS